MQTSRLLALALALVTLPGLASAAPGPAPPSDVGPAPWVGAQLKGTEVIGVTDDSPAATAGLEVGDRVLSVDGLPTPTGEDVAAVVRDGRVGAFVVMRVERGERQLALAVYLAARPGERAAATPGPAPRPPAPSSPPSYDEADREGVAAPFGDEGDDNTTFDNPWDGRADGDRGWEGQGSDEGDAPTGWEATDAPWGDAGDGGDDEGLAAPWGPAPNEVAPSQPTSPQVDAVDLGRYRGGVVVVQFMATWCHACLAVQPQLEAMQRRYGPSGLRVVSVSGEAPSRLAQHRDQRGFTGIFAHDAGDALATRHGVRSLPTIVVFDQEGRPRGRFIGGGGNIARVEGLVASLLNPRRAPARRAPRMRLGF